MKILSENYSIKQTVALAVGTGLLIAIFSIAIGLNMSKQVEHVVDELGTLQSTAIKQDLIGELESNFGYGGAIHNFKNYVLRGQKKYIDRFREKSMAALSAIEAYRKQSITPEEVSYLAAIEGVIRNYMEHGEKIQVTTQRKKTIKKA